MKLPLGKGNIERLAVEQGNLNIFDARLLIRAHLIERVIFAFLLKGAFSRIVSTPVNKISPSWRLL